MKLTLKNKLMLWSGTHNLNWLISFHNYVREFLKDQLKNLEAAKTKSIENKLHKDALYDYDRMLHINTLLMMYSYLEERLYHCWKTYVPNVVPLNSGGSLGRFKNVAKQLGIDLSSTLWQDLKNAEEIRNCLLHANGRISLLRSPQKIKTIIEIIERKNSGLEIIKDRVVISSDYLQWFNETICKLLDSINKYDAQQSATIG